MENTVTLLENCKQFVTHSANIICINSLQRAEKKSIVLVLTSIQQVCK